ncbi:hypothetical protein LCGC14_1954420 [marine sediment metagenome]|uniref:Uncharacterized protein n=1 Tax=marine sediment metagenome TaxID=412755 RepID=A0A0F9FGR8_9ZZZZ
MTTATEQRIARREPLLGQLDLRLIREAAARTLLGRPLAARLERRLTRAELQLLTACDAITEIIRGEYGEDGLGDPVGDLTLRESAVFPVTHQPRLVGGNGNGTG